MAPTTKIVNKKTNLKDKVEDGELDLSMSGLQEVPIKEIAQVKKANKLDLSNNRLTSLGKNFSTLTNIIHLDLSNNMLKELPENFGNLKQLKHLDLYNNQLKHLPLSFSQLKSLKWLDLKNNPLVPALAQVVGPCLDAQQCQKSAKNVVEFLSKMQTKLNDDLALRRSNSNANKNVVENSTKQQKEKQKEKIKKDKKKDKQNDNKQVTKGNANDLKNKNNTSDNKGGKAKKGKVGKKGKKDSLLISVIKKFLTLVFIAFISLPILSYIHDEHIKKNSIQYQNVRENTDLIWNKTVNIMPPVVIKYAETASIYTKPLTDVALNKTVIILEMISEIRHSEGYKLMKLEVQRSLKNFVSKVEELITNLISK